MTSSHYQFNYTKSPFFLILCFCFLRQHGQVKWRTLLFLSQHKCVQFQEILIDLWLFTHSMFHSINSAGFIIYKWKLSIYSWLFDNERTLQCFMFYVLLESPTSPFHRRLHRRGMLQTGPIKKPLFYMFTSQFDFIFIVCRILLAETECYESF